MTMTITVHTDRGPQPLAEGSTVADLLDLLGRTAGLDDSAVATAVNGEFVPRSERAHRTLHDGDAVLCFTAITGG
ncbi:MAG: sulfur carrier protein ThiS [Rubrivivax sp.]|nr:MAG: sulfur carrier protein ThiS [Rubrivivax sp.]